MSGKRVSGKRMVTVQLVAGLQGIDSLKVHTKYVHSHA